MTTSRVNDQTKMEKYTITRSFCQVFDLINRSTVATAEVVLYLRKSSKLRMVNKIINILSYLLIQK